MKNLENLVDYRSFHTVVRKSFNAKQLLERVNKDNVLTEKVVISLDDLIKFDRHELNEKLSKLITGSELRLINLDYKVAGRTTKNEVILKVTGKLDLA